MSVQVKTRKEFDEKLKEVGDALVVVDFFAHWCGPCQMIAPKIEEIAAEYPDVVFLKVDVDDCEGIAEYYEITSMPTFVFFKKTEKIDAFSGASPKKLLEYIEKHK